MLLGGRPLQKWDEHQRGQRAAARAATSPMRPRTAPTSSRSTSHAAAHAGASDALARWSRVGRHARAALKQANPQGVLALEVQVQGFADEVGVVRCGPGAADFLPVCSVV